MLQLLYPALHNASMNEYSYIPLKLSLQKDVASQNYLQEIDNLLLI